MTLLVRQLGTGLRMLLVLTVLTGIVYPLLVLGVGQAVAHEGANGSLVTRGSKVVASTSLGQVVPQAAAAAWFLPRPSASAYSGDTSGGTNLGAADAALAKALQADADAVHAANPGAPATLPPDALTASASGLDPDISPAYALLQVARVARARGLSQDRVLALVQDQVKGRLLGFLGEPRVNTTELNLALAGLS
ncbi:MAG: K(+)-transporting ATPase subunit C [Actinomycetota bacterium]|nr:K(+)-transporting ATPase subunit C [Actinomycetota bacterium]